MSLESSEIAVFMSPPANALSAATRTLEMLSGAAVVCRISGTVVRFWFHSDNRRVERRPPRSRARARTAPLRAPAALSSLRYRPRCGRWDRAAKALDPSVASALQLRLQRNAVWWWLWPSRPKDFNVDLSLHDWWKKSAKYGRIGRDWWISRDDAARTESTWLFKLGNSTATAPPAERARF